MTAEKPSTRQSPTQLVADEKTAEQNEQQRQRDVRVQVAEESSGTEPRPNPTPTAGR